MAKVEHKESPMKTVFALHSNSLFHSVPLCRSLCGQAMCASMLVIRTNRDEGGRMGYTPCTRVGGLKTEKQEKVKQQA